MAGEVAGTECLLQIGNIASSPASYTTLEGQTDTSFDGSTNVATTTAKDTGGWQTGKTTTISGTVNCSGNLRGSRALLDKLETAWNTRTSYGCQIVFDAAGNGYKGEFYVTQFNVSAPTEDVVKYSLTLTPSGALTKIPVVP
ncbi:phage tail tube protein [Niveispirillum sp.]|uniref:phage tail tube protein n=1 Tax=Niveispirillum sp. TaxID=1917217 RepID=UPI001B718312|nr:phage tail tube protein [Niveispirillum sp.]MBP7339413.1 hypothetical protein [Niveispirillum sp.]